MLQVYQRMKPADAFSICDGAEWIDIYVHLSLFLEQCALNFLYGVNIFASEYKGCAGVISALTACKCAKEQLHAFILEVKPSANGIVNSNSFRPTALKVANLKSASLSGECHSSV